MQRLAINALMRNSELVSSQGNEKKKKKPKITLIEVIKNNFFSTDQKINSAIYIIVTKFISLLMIFASCSSLLLELLITKPQCCM